MAEYDDGAYYTVHRYDLVVCSRSALGTAANTDTKLLIYRLFQKGRVLAQDGVCVIGAGSPSKEPARPHQEYKRKEPS